MSFFFKPVNDKAFFVRTQIVSNFSNGFIYKNTRFRFSNQNGKNLVVFDPIVKAFENAYNFYIYLSKGRNGMVTDNENIQRI